jgi:hypothetical protein
MAATMWEYKVVRLTGGTLTEEALNNLGAQGWELVTFTERDNSYIFKRPKS